MLEVERRFIAEWLDFIVALRMNDGFDSVKYESLREALGSCVEAGRGKGTIDREVAGVLVEIFPAADAAADAYQSDERSKIREAAYGLHDLIIQGLTSG